MQDVNVLIIQAPSKQTQFVFSSNLKLESNCQKLLQSRYIQEQLQKVHTGKQN